MKWPYGTVVTYADLHDRWMVIGTARNMEPFVWMVCLDNGGVAEFVVGQVRDWTSDDKGWREVKE